MEFKNIEAALDEDAIVRTLKVDPSGPGYAAMVTEGGDVIAAGEGDGLLLALLDLDRVLGEGRR